MGVEFILGRPASGREQEIVNRIRALTGDDPLAPVLVIVPPQATYATECMLMDRLGVDGLMGIDVSSISRVAQRILSDVHGTARKVVGGAGKSMAVRSILDAHAGELKVLGKMRTQHHLSPLVAEAITELKRLEVSPDMLAAFEAPRASTQAKFADIALVYEKYNERMGGYLDAEDRLAIAAGYMEQAAFIREASVFIHGFDMYNAQTVRFISQIMRCAKQVTVSFLYAEAASPDADVYGICDENRMLFYEAAREAGLTVTKVAGDAPKAADILHIEKNLYAYPGKTASSTGDVSVSYASGIREEVDGVAAQIAYLHEKAGVCFSDMAVVCGNSGAYLPMIRERFKKSGIPCFTGEKRGLLQSNLADFVLTAFRLCRGRLRREVVLAHAATGFCDITRGQRALLENYAFGHISNGFAFLKPFDEPEETARRALMEPVERLRAQAVGATRADALVRCVQGYMDALDVRGKIEKKAVHMRDSGLLEQADYLEQAYERMKNVLEQAAEICGGMESGPQLGRMLEAGMAAEEIAVIPPAADEVLCGDISGTYLPDVKVLFVMGANEGVIPDCAGAADVITEEERELILGGLKGLRHTGSLDKQKLAIVKALSRPSEKLYISCVEDGNMQPSMLVDRLFSILKNSRRNRMADIAPLLKQNAWELTARCFRGAADGAIRNDCPKHVEAAVYADEAFAGRLARMERRMGDRNTPARLKEETARALYGDFTASVTRVESYYKCPYRHFMRYGVKAEQPREYTADQLDVGRYVHAALDVLAKEIGRDKKEWGAYDEPEFMRMVRASVQKTRGEYERFALNRQNETILDEVGREVETAAWMIRRQFIMGALQPYRTEYKFATEAAAINGIVDRIDVAEIDGRKYFSIVDYKTGDSDFSLPRMAGGVDLQLIIYVMAVRELLGEEYAFAGANYMRIFEALRERGQALEPMYKMRGIGGVAADVAARLFGEDEAGNLFAVNARRSGGEYDRWAKLRYYTSEEMDVLVEHCARLVRGAAQGIRLGNNDIYPAYDGKGGLACKYCEYAAVCRFDKEKTERARRLPDADRKALLEQMRKETEAE